MDREPYIGRSTVFPPIDEGNREPGVVNRMGLMVVTDIITQMILSSFGYHMQMGTEDAGVAFTTAIDDTVVSMLLDNNTGYALIPLLLEVTPGVIAGATLAQAMLELDKEKKRFSALGAGAAFTPENLNGADLNSFNGSGYVGPDLTALAKSAVPDSVELARRMWLEDALADTIGYPGAWDNEVFSYHRRPLAVALDAASLVAHIGSATADMTGYAIMQVLQLPKAYIVAT